MYNIFELNEKSLDDLKIIATEMGIDDENRKPRNPKKPSLRKRPLPKSPLRPRKSL